MPQAHSKPSDVTAVDGEVEVVGPGGIVVSLTPDAAVETSQRLLAAALTAREQVET